MVQLNYSLITGYEYILLAYATAAVIRSSNLEAENVKPDVR